MVTELENLPDQLNAASVFIDENIQNGRGDNIAIYYGDETLTYQDVSEEEIQLAFWLKNLSLF